MDLTTLRAVLSDLRPKLLPSRFEKAQQPDPATLQLGFRSLQGMLWLELSWQADAPRLVQIPPPPRQGAGSTLSQQIQHSLRQMALIELVQTRATERARRFEGRTVEVLVEGPSRKNPDTLEGRTRCNKIVIFDGAPRHIGQLMDVKITRAGSFTLYGDPAIVNLD